MKGLTQMRVASLATSKYDKCEQCLDLHNKEYQKLDTQTIKLLFNKYSWESIRKLYLVLTSRHDQQFEVLLDSNLPKLQILDIGSNKITDASMKLFSQKKWDSLIQLYLSNNSIEDQGFKYLTQTQLIKISQLFVGNAKLTYKSMTYWKTIDNSFQNLKMLSLTKNNIGSKGIKLFWYTQLRSLTQLYLSECNIGDEGIKYLTKATFPKLSVLYFGFNQIKKDGFDIIYLNNWKHLKFADLQTKQIDALSLFSLTKVNWRKFQFNLMYFYGVLNLQLKYYVERVLGRKFEDPPIFLDQELQMLKNTNQQYH